MNKRCKDCQAFKQEKFSPIGLCMVWGEQVHENEHCCNLKGKTIQQLKKSRKELNA
jgi:hypothetical protein